MFTFSSRCRHAVVAPALAIFGWAAALGAQVVAPSAETGTYGPPPYYGYGYGGGGGGWAWGWGNNPGIGSTAAGSYLGGLGETIRAQGQYNLMTSEAAVNLEEAARRDIENREKWTNTYFEMRRINKAYRAAKAEPKHTSEDWVRLAHDAAPQRLDANSIDTVTGRIAWPTVLQTDLFSKNRATLEQLFAQRAEAYGAVGLDNYTRIRAAVDDALAKLKDQIRNLDTRLYLEARNFLTGLAREADFPSG